MRKFTAPNSEFLGARRAGAGLDGREPSTPRSRHHRRPGDRTAPASVAVRDFRQKGRLQVWELGASGVRLQAKDRKPRLRSWDIEGAVEGLAQTAIDGQTWQSAPHPRPRAWPLAPRRFDLGRVAAGLAAPGVHSLSGIRSFYPGPSTVSVKCSNKHLFSEHLVCASQFAQDFLYCPT